jgi:DNA polymerase-3 subunit alpha
MNALYRPGPMGNIPSFINRKHNKEPIKYLHPIMENVLKNTYGVIVYQEQVMQLVQDLAGFSLGQADIMRRAMGKKKKEEMIKLKTEFADGCKKNNISKKLSDEIFELILAFANYGFNKSHSLAYSYLAFQTA